VKTPEADDMCWK